MIDNNIEDKILLNDFKNGDEGAFEKLFDKYSDRVRSFIYKSIKNYDVADEMMQEVFIVLYRNPERYSEKSKLINFILAIAKNKIKEYWRNKLSRDKTIEKNARELANNSKNDLSSLEIIEKEEEISEVHKILKNMNPTYSMAIRLIDFQEYSYEEAAKIMGKTNDQIKVIIYRARQKLKSEMERNFPDTARKYSRKNIISMVLAVIIGASLVTGLVYAAIKLYQKHFLNNDTFKLSDIEESVDEENVSIDREHAKEIIDLYLKALGYSEYNLDDVELENDSYGNVIEWVLYDKNFKIWIDSDNGNLTRYNNMNEIENAQTMLNVDDILIKTQDLYNKLNFKGDYEYYSTEIINVASDYTVYNIVYLEKRDGELNNLNGIVFQYILELGVLHDINSFNYSDDNSISISKEEAINIVKEKYGDVEILDIYLDSVLDPQKDYTEYDGKGINEDLNSDFKNRANLKIWRVEVKINELIKIIHINPYNGEVENIKEDYSTQEEKY